jgi:hypothetical protein
VIGFKFYNTNERFRLRLLGREYPEIGIIVKTL